MDRTGLAPRVLLIDDHPLFRQALAATVRHARPDAQIEEYVSLGEARAALGQAEAFVFLDLRLPDAQGLSGLLALKAQAPNAAIAIVSATDDALTVQGAMACGASGFISKAAGVDELTAAIETLFAGEAFVPDTPAPDTPDPLTPAQTRILEAIHRGLMNKQIAWEMGISEATVKYHLTGIFRKLGVQTRAQLLTLARPGA
ncbi:MAG TPA: response regulator transcription factor [Novosphingobium sp.]|nr:response regulator transcription factor [Novosphingobium sp.]